VSYEVKSNHVYSSVLCGHHDVNILIPNIHLVESVQSRAVRFVTGDYGFASSVGGMLRYLDGYLWNIDEKFHKSCYLRCSRGNNDISISSHHLPILVYLHV